MQTQLVKNTFILRTSRGVIRFTPYPGETAVNIVLRGFSASHQVCLDWKSSWRILAGVLHSLSLWECAIIPSISSTKREFQHSRMHLPPKQDAERLLTSGERRKAAGMKRRDEERLKNIHICAHTRVSLATVILPCIWSLHRAILSSTLKVSGWFRSLTRILELFDTSNKHQAVMWDQRDVKWDGADPHDSVIITKPLKLLSCTTLKGTTSFPGLNMHREGLFTFNP